MMLDWFNELLSRKKRRKVDSSKTMEVFKNRTLLSRIFACFNAMDLYQVQHVCTKFHEVVDARDIRMRRFGTSVPLIPVKQYFEMRLNQAPLAQELKMHIIFKNQRKLKFCIYFSSNLKSGAYGKVDGSMDIFKKNVKEFLTNEDFNSQNDVSILFELSTIKMKKFRWIPCVTSISSESWKLSSTLWTTGYIKKSLSLRVSWKDVSFQLNVWVKVGDSQYRMRKDYTVQEIFDILFDF